MGSVAPARRTEEARSPGNLELVSYINSVAPETPGSAASQKS